MRVPQYAALAVLATSVAAHPGHDITEELEERRAYLGTIERSSLDHCAEKLKARGVYERNVRRRAELIESVRVKRGLKKRTFEDVLATDHNKTHLGYTPNTDADTLFQGQNSCLLTPEVTQGPYYVGGEYVRTDVTEDQAGVPLIIDYQVIDVDTCEPVAKEYLEIWHCNSLGVYGGVVAQGNGDPTDQSNIDNTWLRGIQPTDDDGVVQFQTIFPGHYIGRATHIHLMVHTNATLLPNQTLGNDIYASHVGQAFFDQSLITVVEQTDAYTPNTQELTLNADDRIFAQEAATDGVDPSMEYTLLGDSIEDGVFGWLAFGINTTRSAHVNPAVFLYEEGGVANPDSGFGGGPGGPGGPRPNGTAPGGGRPPSQGTGSENEPRSTKNGASESAKVGGWAFGVVAMAMNFAGFNVL